MPQMKNFISALKKNRKQIIIWVGILISAIVAIEYGVDEKIVLFITVVLSLFTQVFVGLAAIVALIPWFGPVIVKVFTIPFFYIVNALGNIVSFVAIQKGYTKNVKQSRIITLALVIGMVIGYLLGSFVPI